MKNFKEYVEAWFHEYLLGHEDIEGFYLEILNGVANRDESDCLDDYLNKDENVLDCLLSLKAEEIWEKVIRPGDFDDLPSVEEFLNEMFMQAVDGQFQHDYNPCNYSFVEDFVSDMAYNADGYESPIGFFKDLAYGGCKSGMISTLIYNDDCKRIYIEHIDDMELTKEYLEGEMGEPITNKDSLPHYTFMCWLSYEQLAYNIGRNLFPDFF